jgi:hypothetical protein
LAAGRPAETALFRSSDKVVSNFDEKQQQVPFGFGQGRLPAPLSNVSLRITAFLGRMARISTWGWGRGRVS